MKEQRVSADLNRAGRSEGVLAVSQNRFGGSSKFKLSVARLEAILGGVVRDDLAELTTDSIYTKRERWPGIGTMTRGCWGPSASEGPQKCDLTMFAKWII